jgi:hypothetical protein
MTKMTGCMFGNEIIAECDVVNAGIRGPSLVSFCQLCPHLEKYKALMLKTSGTARGGTAGQVKGDRRKKKKD